MATNVSSQRNNGTRAAGPAPVRCAIYTRKSTEEGLDQEFNSLDAQREAAEAYIASQRAEGWLLSPDRYDDGGFSGGSMERPALQRLLRDVEAGKIGVVVVYKVDRLSRSLLDFTRIVDLFDQHGVSFVSVTQSFNTTTSMGRLTLNILLSFAQFEREIIGERIRDKVAAAKRKGKYMGGPAILGYDVDRAKKRLVVNQEEANVVRHIFQRFVEMQSTTVLAKDLNEAGFTTKAWTTVNGRIRPGMPWNKAHLYRLLNNRLYLGEVVHKGDVHRGEHEAIVSSDLWDRAHEILAENHHARGNKLRARTPALLKGILRCGHCGCAMGVTWSRKNGRQYRYYLCVHASKSGYGVCPVKTAPAGDIENAVLAHVRVLLRSPEMIAETFRAARSLDSSTEPPCDEREVAAALETLDALWESLFPAEQARIVQLLVARAVLTTGGLDVAFRLEGLQGIAGEMMSKGEGTGS